MSCVETSKIIILNAVHFAVHGYTVLLKNVLVKCTTFSANLTIDSVVVQIK